MKGIAVAGTLLVDKIYQISNYPKAGELTQINGISRAVGGCVPNVGIDLKNIDGELPVYAMGTVGADEEGDFLRSTLKNYGLDVSGIVLCEDKSSFTDVMSVHGGERTFFTYPGASALFGTDYISLDPEKIDLLHLGYFLLLKKVDEGDGLKILRSAKTKGIKTSIDLVSENSDRYKLVTPCLPFVDYLIINEIEGGKLTGIEPKRENIKSICQSLMEQGVSEKVIIHMPDFGACLSKDGYTEVPSLLLPEGFVKGATGAGDAFCAGALYGIHKGFSDREILEFASQSAGISLRAADAVSGMLPYKEILEFFKGYQRKKI